MFDGAGLVETASYDFKGNLLATSRRLAVDFTDEPDWTPVASSATPSAALAQAASLLETETFSKAFSYDALNRTTSATMPDLSVLRPTFNEAGLLEAVDARIRGASDANGDPVWTAFVTGIAYDEKGRRTKIEYGNGTFTEYFYDPLSFRLTRLRTTRSSDGAKLQDLFYFYDPVGNITTIRDDAQQEVFFAGQQVTSTQEFEYDAIYRLISATGREHAGGVGDVQRDQNDLPLWSLPHPNDAQALRQYTETYAYDGVGNILEMFHNAGNGSPGTWRRRYAYGANPFGPGAPTSNRLHSTSLPGDAEQGPYTAAYSHDDNGNMVAMPHLAEIAYTHADQMKRADLGGGGTAYYTYDASGERVRKVIQRLGTTREERIYLGGWELYRKRQGAGGDLVLERETLHVMDDARRIAMVETKTVDADVQGPLAIVPRIRYQYGNHLDSAHLECDETGLVISYEEYHPYGTPAYRSARSGVEVSDKRYRYTGKERDDETGFQYHSARYLAPWLGRWTSADPGGLVDDASRYSYAAGAPVVLVDPSGTQALGPTRARAAEMEAEKRRRAPAEAERLRWEDATKNHDLKAIMELRRTSSCTTAKLPEGVDTPQPPPATPAAPKADIARPQKRVMTTEDVMKIIDKSRGQPLYGVGVAAATALGQTDPDQIDKAGDFATSVGAVASMAHLGQMARQERARLSANKDERVPPDPSPPKQLPAGPPPPKPAPGQSWSEGGKAETPPSEKPLPPEPIAKPPTVGAPAQTALPAFSESTINSAVEQMARPASSEISVGARALDKKIGHALSSGAKSAFSGVPRTTETAQRIIRETMTNPVRIVFGKRSYDVYDALGRGARFDMNGNFVGFLEASQASR